MPAEYDSQPNQNSILNKNSHPEVLTAALQAALQRLMATGRPDCARVALVVRQLVGAVAAAGGDKERLRVFRWVSRGRVGQEQLSVLRIFGWEGAAEHVLFNGHTHFFSHDEAPARFIQTKLQSSARRPRSWGRCRRGSATAGKLPLAGRRRRKLVRSCRREVVVVTR